jgi:glutamate synthase (ferredoxin)
MTVLLELARPALERGERVYAELPIRNIHRTVGTITGSELTRRWGGGGLPEDTLHFKFNGSAGQSFAAFVPAGMTMEVEGDANDYFGKGLSGGKLIIYPPKTATFVPEENIIIGNVALYGATSGQAFIRGVAGERFCVRNSGALAVVEGVGDHGCEYMTGGRVVILGSTGRNFAAGMSGGIAYVLDEIGDFGEFRCNRDMVELEELSDPAEIEQVRELIARHVRYTDSAVGKRVLDKWDEYGPRFVKVMPIDYKRVLQEQAERMARKAARRSDGELLEVSRG